MSLELAIQANTAAIQQLIATIMSGKMMHPSVQEMKDHMGEVGDRSIQDDMNAEEERAAVDRINARAAKQDQEARARSREDSRPVEEPKAAVPVTEPVIEPTKPLAYEADVLPVLHKFLVAKGKPAAESLLKKYGVDKFSKVPAVQLGDLLADIQKEMGVA